MTTRLSVSLLPLGILSTLAALTFSAACDGQPEFGSVNCANPEMEAECGTTCAVTSDCVEGLYCLASTRTCQADCVAGEEKSRQCDGESCAEDGQCSGADDRSTKGKDTIDVVEGGADDATSDQNEECIDVVVDFEPVIPNVVLLIDQSLSMDEKNFGSSVDEAIGAGTYEAWDCGDDYDWRWNVVRNVLLHPTTGVVKPLEDQVRFGLALYSSENGFSGGTCPLLDTIDVGFGTHADMLATFQCSDLVAQTPTRESLTATAEALAAAQLDGENVIVLATDGEPDTCVCYNWSTSIHESCSTEAGAAEKDAVAAEARRIREESGIVTHVIDVSRPDNVGLRQHLTDVASAGGGDIFDGTNPGGLSDAFQTIMDGVRSCAIDLDGKIEPGKEHLGRVLLNGDGLKLDGDDGWVVNSPTQIELVGAACETIKRGVQDLDISFPCGAFIPPVTK